MDTKQNSLLEEYKRIRAPEVCELCGGIHNNTLARWIRDPDMNFPKPARLGQVRTWTPGEILGWINERGTA